LTKLAQLTPSSIFADKEKINAKVSPTFSTMFRQAHKTNMIDHVNKKQVRVDESISIGQALTRFIRNLSASFYLDLEYTAF
jgi:hypothetical protein